jgi:hypothetical protein
MLTITDYPKRIQWEIFPEKERHTPIVQDSPQKPTTLPRDEVALQKRVNICVSDEYLVATYWG